MPKTFIKFLEEIVQGSVAGLSIVLVSHPVDTLKTRKQVDTSRYHRMIQSMIRKEGILSFYKGLISPMVSLPFIKACLFSCYNQSLRKLEEIGLFKDNHKMQTVTAGLITGFFISFICGPTDLFKVKMQVQKGTQNRFYSSYWDVLRKTWRVSGYRAIFQGQWATILQNIMSYPLNFMVYDSMVRYYGDGDKKNANNWHHFFAGSVSGGLGWLMMFPIDVVKTQINSMQLTTKVRLFNNFQILRMMRKIYLKKGIFGLYHGFGVYFVRAFPANGVAFLVWNWTQENVRFA